MGMSYISTRGQAQAVDFERALLGGLAPDGGLYVPQIWPAPVNSEIAHSFRGQSYNDLAEYIIAPFTHYAAPDLRPLIDGAYASFRHNAVAPLRQMGPGLWLMELFHGPTLAFKDVALQLLARMFDHALSRVGHRLTIIGATSGDTGSAALAACAGLAHVEVFMLFPKGRISDVQRRQMTTLDASNLHAIAIDGSFDDCQALVKRCFADPRARARFSLSAVNSINWARILIQAVYYAWGAVQLGGVGHFIVPSGNFGNIYAGHVARRLGWHQARLIAATNSNDILHRLFDQGEYHKSAVQATLSPSMDIQIASNFERLLFEALDCDGARTADFMARLDREGGFSVDRDLISLKGRFAAACIDDAETLDEMRQTHADTGILVDPHTAIGLRVARRMKLTQSGLPTVVLGTAHPAKFPDAAHRAIGQFPALPPGFDDLMQKTERSDDLSNSLTALIDYMEQNTGF